MAGFKPGVPELEATALPSEPSTLDTYFVFAFVAADTHDINWLIDPPTQPPTQPPSHPPTYQTQIFLLQSIFECVLFFSFFVAHFIYISNSAMIPIPTEVPVEKINKDPTKVFW